MKTIDLTEYNYNLPNDRIAAYPLKDRSFSKLLIYKNNQISTSSFNQLAEFLPEDSLLCMNETKVIHARLFFKNSTGAQIEILCLEPHKPNDYAQNFSSHTSVVWKTLIGNKKKWKNGPLKTEIDGFDLIVEKIEDTPEFVLVKFSWTNPTATFGEILEKSGHIPLPPYIKREDTTEDKSTYQTVFAKIQGSVAAPTAGLHITEKLLGDLNKKNIETAKLILHVGAGTFKPIKSASIEEHEMHAEFFSISRASIAKIVKSLKNNQPIIALGTTVARTLETLYWLGLNPSNQLHQWAPYQTHDSLSPIESLESLLQYLDQQNQSEFSGYTALLITPNYRFKVVDALITNFHQPQSTLLLLVAAMVGDDWKTIYDYALKNEFRFLSYGDGSLLFGNQK
jgi:S-adenosylmethionine:tRNA ribosyltransferase-isomerase